MYHAFDHGSYAWCMVAMKLASPSDESFVTKSKSEFGDIWGLKMVLIPCYTLNLCHFLRENDD